MSEQPSSAATIRPRRDDDLSTLGAVLVQVHDSDGYPVEGIADPESWLVSDASLGAWTAEMDGVPVGHVMLTSPRPGDDAARLWVEQSGVPADSVAVLGRLFVSSSARGHQLGRRLTQVATAYARALGRRPVLDVMAKDAAAIHTYEQLGWTRIGSIAHTFGTGNTEPALAFVAP